MSIQSNGKGKSKLVAEVCGGQLSRHDTLSRRGKVKHQLLRQLPDKVSIKIIYCQENFLIRDAGKIKYASL